MLWAGSQSSVWDIDRLHIATDAAGVALWSWNIDTDEIQVDERAHGLWRVPGNERAVTFEDLSTAIHADDLQRVRCAFRTTRATLEPFEIDFRVILGNETKWISARGQGDDSHPTGHIMFGVFLDVTDRKRAEEAHQMIAAEMNHRVKNLFAIATALTGIAARSSTTNIDMAEDLIQRLTALSRAHDLVRPTAGIGPHPTGKLKLLLEVLLAPYTLNETTGNTIHISVPNVCVGESAITTLALIVHELATNSIKYGALSVASGILDITCCDASDEITLMWVENGGPTITNTEKKDGFGSKLINQALRGQLGGSIAYDWSKKGVSIGIQIKKDLLAA